MKFHELKPGMVLYDTRRSLGTPGLGGTQLVSWSAIKSKFSDAVVIDDYWKGSPKGHFYKDYSRVIKKRTWNSGYWSRSELVTYAQAKRLIVTLFKRVSYDI